MADAPRPRPSLEPLAPAVAGIGLAIVVIGIVAWTLIPLLATKDDAALEKDDAALAWQSPAAMAPPAAPVVEKVPPPAVPPVPPPTAEVKPAPATPEAAPAPAPNPAPTQPAAAETSPAPVAEPQAGRPPTLASVAKSVSTPAPSTTPATVAAAAPTAPVYADTLGSATGLDGGLFRPLAGGISSQLGTGFSQATAQRALAAAAAPSTTRRQPITSPQSAPALREAGKFISLSIDAPESSATAAASKSAAPRPVPSLLDIARVNDAERVRAEITGGTDVSGVEQALQTALLQAWVPPSPAVVPVGRRSVIVRLALLRDGTVQDAAIHTPSGSPELDASVTQALKKVGKIPESLPAKFPGPRYPLRAHLQID